MRLKAILFDLDDTLLATRMDQFIPKYLSALGSKFSDLMDPQKLIDLVLESTQLMIESQDPDLTNEQVFYKNFYSKISFSKTNFIPRIEEFYEIDFPKLHIHTNSIPGISEQIEILNNNGYILVIATNPLFPKKAIEHRINWAGLSGIQFKMITTYENSHFCKPNPKYYQEIIDTLNVHPNEAIMVGDDYNNDILPAETIGINTFFINNETYRGLSGSIQQFFSWLEKNK